MRGRAASDGYARVGRAGLWIVGIGAIGFIVASVWSPAYQGPMTGIGPALMMIAAIGAMGVGVVVAVVSFGLRAVKRSRTPDSQ